MQSSQPHNNENHTKLFEEIQQSGQKHLIQHYEKLSQQKKSDFLKQLLHIDFDKTNQLYHHVYLESKKPKEEVKLDFTPVEHVSTHEDLKIHAQEFDELGYEAIGRGQVAVCIMSGGQGTRLGFDHPKGMFNLGLKSNLTLFGYFANRLLRLNEITKSKLGITHNKCLIQWYLMTSQMNHQEIQTYFKQNNYFGYDPQAITFFPQGGIPAVFYDGKIIIEQEGKISLAPGGNGAIYEQMQNKDVLKHMNSNGVKYIYLGPVDNVLLKLADPTSLGYMIKNNFDIVSHYLKKYSSAEKVGLHITVNGKTKILEYSEVSTQAKQLKNEKGELLFQHGSRATMYITYDFIVKLLNSKETMQKINKKYHLAEKKVKYYDQTSKTSITPKETNGAKFELFYFDIFEETDRLGVFQTLRDQQFAPLKNATGDDSPATARDYLNKLHRRWVEAAGVTLEGEGTVEIHPRRSYNGQGLAEYIKEKYGQLKLTLPIYVD